MSEYKSKGGPGMKPRGAPGLMAKVGPQRYKSVGMFNLAYFYTCYRPGNISNHHFANADLAPRFSSWFYQKEERDGNCQ
jgi:hypothetical protein